MAFIKNVARSECGGGKEKKEFHLILLVEKLFTGNENENMQK
jgi:hypothetical protein